MKNRILLILMMTFALFNLNAQNNRAIVLQEDFEGDWLPDGWVNEPLGGNNQPWMSSNGGQSGHPASAHSGVKNAIFYLGGTHEGIACNLITPAMDLSHGGYTLEFWHAQEDWEGDQDELYVYYKEGASGTWNLLESYTNSVPEWTRRQIPIPSTSNEVYIAFKGVQDWGYGVCIDDVKVSYPEPHDLGVTSITPDFVFSGSTVTPKVTIYNYGENNEAAWSVNLTDGSGYNETISNLSSVTSDTELTIDFPDWSPADGATSLTATVTLTDDGVSENNTLSASVQVGAGEYDNTKIYTYYWGGSNSTGTISKETPIWKQLYREQEFESIELACGEYINGEVYTIDDMTGDVYLMRADGHLEYVNTVSGVGSNEIVFGLAYDKNTGDLFASTFDQNTTSKLYSVNMSTWELTLIGTMTDNGLFMGLAFDNESNLYGLDIENNVFSSVDKTTGAATTIGSTDYDYLDWEYPQDIGGDSETGVIYGTIYDNDIQESYLGTFDVTTGHFTRLGGVEYSFNESSVCAVIPEGSEPSFVNNIAYDDICIYPNPANGKFTINVNDSYKLDIIDITGKIIDSKVISKTESLKIEKSGIYFLKLYNNKGSVTKKIVIK